MTTTTMHALTVATPDGTADAFACFPDDGQQHPAVLLYMDIFGLRPELKARAQELASHGYYVLVPNVFHRHGAAPLVELPAHVGAEDRPALVTQLMPLVAEHTTARALRDADAYLAFLAAAPEVAPGPVAVIGYCMGAVLAIRTAAAHPDRVAAVAGFHPGNLVRDSADSPHLLLPELAAEVHLGHAATDVAPEAVAELNATMDAAGVAYTSEIYPGSVHGFTMSDTDAFDEASLQLHWDRLLPLLERTLTR